ncbi:MAG: peptidase M14, partial [Firmicutes bacterium]|nr:peptidase M14 [Bacillota bacterium]
EDIGPTTEDDTMIMAIVSSPDTIARLEYYKGLQKKLADPRGLSAEELEKLKSEAKTVFFVNTAGHSTEVGGVHALTNVLYRLGTSDDAEVAEILENTIVLIVPTLNPDGHDMVANWYRDTLGTEFEGTNQPWLYARYCGHDNNRDWFMFNLQESRNIGKILYQEWFPEIIYDIHQMGSDGARFFIPPFFDPPNWEIDPLILRQIMLLGGAATTELCAQGMSGVCSNAIYDTWWHGGMRSAPYYHNMVGLLTEAASVKLATPITVEKPSGARRGLADPNEFLTNNPDPWPGGEWRLGDIVAYEEATVFSFLKTAARYRDMFINNFVLMGQKAVTKGEKEAPFAFVIPADQSDPATVAKMLEILSFQGTEIHQARMAFKADGKTYPAGSYVIKTQQPYRANVIALLDTQTYPDRLEYPGGPAERPYDVAGWTLPYQMGVECVRVVNKFTAELEPVDEITPPAGSVVKGNAAFGYAFGPEMNNAVTARLRLLEKGFDLKWAKEEFATAD